MSKPANKNYNTTITGTYKLSNGGFWSMPLDARAYDALQTAKVGDRLIFKPVKAEIKESKGEKFPDGFIEIIPAENLKTFPQSSRSGGEASGARTSKATSGSGGDGSSDDWS